MESNEEQKQKRSLNPSYTGIWLRGQIRKAYKAKIPGLNPSYTGIWLRGRAAAIAEGIQVIRS